MTSSGSSPPAAAHWKISVGRPGEVPADPAEDGGLVDHPRVPGRPEVGGRYLVVGDVVLRPGLPARVSDHLRGGGVVGEHVERAHRPPRAQPLDGGGDLAGAESGAADGGGETVSAGSMAAGGAEEPPITSAASTMRTSRGVRRRFTVRSRGWFVTQLPMPARTGGEGTGTSGGVAGRGGRIGTGSARRCARTCRRTVLAEVRTLRQRGVLGRTVQVPAPPRRGAAPLPQRPPETQVVALLEPGHRVLERGGAPGRPPCHGRTSRCRRAS